MSGYTAGSVCLLSLSTGEELQEETTIELPKNVIMGSVRGLVSVVGKLKTKKTSVGL